MTDKPFYNTPWLKVPLWTANCKQLKEPNSNTVSAQIASS